MESLVRALLDAPLIKQVVVVLAECARANATCTMVATAMGSLKVREEVIYVRNALFPSLAQGQVRGGEFFLLRDIGYRLSAIAVGCYMGLMTAIARSNIFSRSYRSC